MGPEQLLTAARAASPLIAATTTDQHLQAAIAAERPDLRAALAANPAVYPGLRDWLAEASRRTAAEAAGTAGAEAGAPADAGPVEATGSAAGPVETVAAGRQEGPAEGPAGTQTTLALPAETAVLPVGALLADGAAGAADHGWGGPGAFPQPGPQAPIQVVAPAVHQAPPAGTQPQAPGGPARRRRLRLVLLICLLVLALVGAGAVIALLRLGERPATSAPSGSAGPSAPASALPTAGATPSATEVSRCATDPVYEVRAVRDSGDGLEADVHVTPTCQDGDVLAGASNLVTLSAALKGTSLSSSTRVVAAVAVFDLSQVPVGVPASGADVTFVFEPSLNYVSAAQIAVERAELSVARDLSGGARATTASGTARLDTAGAPDAATMDAIWLGLLRDQADADSATVSGPLDGTWVPQLSSKKPGLILGGTTWDASAVWEHYLSLKAVYPSAVLLYSDDWSVFDAGGHWWVVAVAEPFATAEEANAWCTAQGLSRDDCFAKYLKVGGSSEGTTVLR
ncbi:hypothetical protein [Actinomyces sp. 217892]|uniref:variant leucine-rich repeat-containing protein n=1 Tax=Actinomyces sp. 217892 TaxID=2927827 RepID=UPI002030FC56|nr:hypothetical protein [Actinomyces sp. 217892]